MFPIYNGIYVWGHNITLCVWSHLVIFSFLGKTEEEEEFSCSDITFLFENLLKINNSTLLK